MLVLRPIRGAMIIAVSPVVSPPANIRCASGTKTVEHFLARDDFVRIGRKDFEVIEGVFRNSLGTFAS